MPIPYVKGIELPSLNPCHTSMLALFAEEHENISEPERIDKVEIIHDYSIRIYTSRFIELVPPTNSSLPHRHLQIMSTYRMWDDDPQPDLMVADPYCEYERSREYREVMLSSVYRTLDGDKGWIVNVNPTTHEPDRSDLNVWDGRI